MDTAQISSLRNIKLLPPQEKFIFNNNTYSLFSGGFGSGKTVALVLKALILSQMLPGNTGLIGRLTYPELRDTTQKTFFEFCPPDWYSESMAEAGINQRTMYGF